ncbi:hypothetical protein [Microbacterium sp. NPDC091662]|uniref:hypothetical protein n=1 Tax=Microbacterium sp. NPDC091662 TaxID=3364211 RepID=UPI0037F29197
MMTIENSLMETPTDRIASLCEVMNDLARSADTQGARAAAADDVDASSELFGLAALLRTEAADLESGESTVDHGQEILDGAQRLVVQQMLRIDRLQQTPSPFVIGRPGRGAFALNRRLELLGRAFRGEAVREIEVDPKAEWIAVAETERADSHD